ncbi:MAG: hypothetical protein CL844_06865 [Crocinitomicaceae bacterium]|nr:hypothetical protein [Crocinitomicaceae bacterium]
MKNIKLILLLFFLVFGFNFVFSQGCSQCKLLAEQGSGLDEASFGSNINLGILYLMALPYILLFFLFRKKIVTLLRGLIR